MKCVSLGLGQDIAFLEKMHLGMLRQGKDGEVLEIMISTSLSRRLAIGNWELKIGNWELTIDN